MSAEPVEIVRRGYVGRTLDGRLAHLRAYLDPDEALAAAGLRPDPNGR